MSDAFAAVLKEHRMAAKLSRQTIAARAGVHYTYVGLIERNERNPSLDVADSLAKAVGKTLSELIEEAENIQRKRT